MGLLLQVPMQPLSALLLSDGKPGHYHSAEGILAAANRILPVVINRVEVRRPRIVAPRILAQLISWRAPPEFILRRVLGLDPYQWPQSSLVVSAGGDTLAANIAATRLLGAKNIFFGSLRTYRPEDFSLALNSYATRAPAANQIQVLKPSRTDPGTIPAPPSEHDAKGADFGLLIGGDAGTVRYDATDWDLLFSLICSLRAREGVRWIVSNSRRTPATVSDRLARLASKVDSPIRQFIDVRSAGPGTLVELFRASSVVVITADSSAMLSEAIWMRRAAIAVAPRAMTLPEPEAAYRRWLESQHWCVSLGLDELTPEAMSLARTRIRPMLANPQAELSEVLARHLPQLFASKTAMHKA